ncbi:hypothetical protein ACH5RR_025727 [Cinchona calisaya]|uniref:Uncharacterized protein n=1 Tax=Cinchona calisaya TaxID=153742 RepID=A0ABD2Z3U6_9GENT
MARRIVIRFRHPGGARRIYPLQWLEVLLMLLDVTTNDHILIMWFLRIAALEAREGAQEQDPEEDQEEDPEEEPMEEKP